MGKIEDSVSNLFDQIDQAKMLPPHKSPEFLLLVFFVLLQHARTQNTVDALDEMTDKMMKLFLGPFAERKGIDLDRVTISMTNAPQVSITMVTKYYPLLCDLQHKLLTNRTDVDFITSDNPVVLYNQFMNFRRYASNTGLGAKGLQIFLPISPKSVILLYDQDVYRVGDNRKNVIEIVSKKDIEEINILQMCSCSENVYFADKHLTNCIALHKKAKQFLQGQKFNVASFLRQQDENSKRELIVTSREDIRTNLNLSFLLVMKSAKEWREKFKKLRVQPSAVLRNDRLYDDHEEFLWAVGKNFYAADGFFKFLRDKYKKR